MSKMGRYVFQIQEEIDQYDHPDREGYSYAQPDEATRSSIRRNGNRGLFCGTGSIDGSEASSGSETEGHPIPKAPPTKEV